MEKELLNKEILYYLHRLQNLETKKYLKNNNFGFTA